MMEHKESYPEYRLNINTAATATPGVTDVASFLDRLPSHIRYVKISLDAFSFAIQNTAATADYFSIDVKTNVFSQFVLGTDRNLLYSTKVYCAAGNGATANDLGSPTKYMIVSKQELYSGLTISWTATPVAAGVAAFQGVFASLSLKAVEM